MPPSLALLLVLFGGLLLLALFLDDIASQIRLPGILLVLVLGLLIDNNVQPGPRPAASAVEPRPCRSAGPVRPGSGAVFRGLGGQLAADPAGVGAVTAFGHPRFAYSQPVPWPWWW